jgi:hypothetical protein
METSKYKAEAVINIYRILCIKKEHLLSCKNFHLQNRKSYYCLRTSVYKIFDTTRGKDNEEDNTGINGKTTIKMLQYNPNQICRKQNSVLKGKILGFKPLY